MKIGLVLLGCTISWESDAFMGVVSKGRMSSVVSVSSEAVRKSEVIAPLDDTDYASIGKLYESCVQNTYGRYPQTITHGKGCKLYDSNGKEYLDFVAGIATCALGHGNKELQEAICDQMSQLHHISNLYYIPQQAVFAKWLTDNSCADKVFFCNSGAEANEAAIKLARRHASNRGITDPVIITAINSFHGRTLAALTATGQPKYHKGFGYGNQMVAGFEYVPFNDVAALEEMVQKINSDDDELAAQGRKRAVAAIMLEPLQGEGGIVPATPEYFSSARRLCDQNSALFICDEVQTGMGRTGTLWCHQALDVQPDVFTSAKALGGGVPIGAMMAKGDAADVFGPGDHASTYGGNPLACRAGIAVARFIAQNNVLENVRRRGDQLISSLQLIASKYPQILTGKVRGKGLLLGVEVRNDVDVAAGDLVSLAMDKGLLLVPAGPKVVRFVPPLIVTQEEVDKAVQLFESALEEKSKTLLN